VGDSLINRSSFLLYPTDADRRHPRRREFSRKLLEALPEEERLFVRLKTRPKPADEFDGRQTHFPPARRYAATDLQAW